MFQKQIKKPQSTLPRLVAEYPAPALLEPECDDVVVNRREDYLDRVLAPLTHLLPFARRQELRLEIRQHLDAMIEAYRELGETDEKACDKAFAQFGQPEEVAESIKKSAVYPSRWQRLQAWCSQPRMSIAGALPVVLLATTLYFGLARPVTPTQSAKTASLQVAAANGKTMIDGVPFSHQNAVILNKIACTSCHAGNPRESAGETLARTQAALESTARTQARLRQLENNGAIKLRNAPR